MKTFNQIVQESLNSVSKADIRKVKALLKKNNPKYDEKAIDILLKYFKDPDDAEKALDQIDAMK